MFLSFSFDSFKMWHIGFRTSSVTVSNYTFSYAERGKQDPSKPTMLFLHGFSAAKDMWWPFVKVNNSNCYILSNHFCYPFNKDKNLSTQLWWHLLLLNSLSIVGAQCSTFAVPNWWINLAIMRCLAQHFAVSNLNHCKLIN